MRCSQAFILIRGREDNSMGRLKREYPVYLAPRSGGVVGERSSLHSVTGLPHSKIIMYVIYLWSTQSRPLPRPPEEAGNLAKARVTEVPAWIRHRGSCFDDNLVLVLPTEQVGFYCRCVRFAVCDYHFHFNAKSCLLS